MRGREPIVPQRRRRIPPQFSWVDHRLVRDGHIQGRSAPALALYLVLVTVADAEGLSWYSDAALCRRLSWSGSQLQCARAELERAVLIAYRRPLYQVLDLSPLAITFDRTPGSRPYSADPVSAGEILQRLLAPVGEAHTGRGGGR
jgi:hypothetical protein